MEKFDEARQKLLQESQSVLQQIQLLDSLKAEHAQLAVKHEQKLKLAQAFKKLIMDACEQRNRQLVALADQYFAD